MKTPNGIALFLFAVLFVLPSQAAPTIRIRLPERFRLLAEQQFDLRVEVTGVSDANAALVVQSIEGPGSALTLPAPEVTSDNDANPSDKDIAWTFRKISLGAPGVWVLKAVVNDGGSTAQAEMRVGVQQFQIAGGKRSIILFVGDAMGTSYRDAGRIVAKSTGNRFREGFFDELQEMDSLPVSGMVMTYAMDRIVPDSANTASAWSTGNKTIDGALGVFPDNNDFKFNPSDVQGTKKFALDNPRVETLWEYLKRRHGYKTGIVTTADVTDATPAGEGGHSVTRTLGYDIAKQYVDGVFTTGPTFDVVMGGGLERFASRATADSGDTRNLVSEMKGLGFTYVKDRTELKALPPGGGVPDKLLGLFRTSNMNVAYDKLGFVRPQDEPQPDFGRFNDQPFLDEMADKAITVLSKNCSPFILMVEGASIDKQSHLNYAAGTIWDTIEFDKAIGIGRKFVSPAACATEAGSQTASKPLILATADHDQSMLILGVSDTSVRGTVPNTKSNEPYPVSTSQPAMMNSSASMPMGSAPMAMAMGSSPAVVTSSAMPMGTNPAEVGGFPDYQDANGDGYPENTNRMRIAVGFRTSGHVGSSVPITAEGPGALLFTGYFDQTDIFFKMARVLSGDTTAYDEVLKKMKSEIVGQNY